ncbi:hypothetical protein CEXT_128952, partial [Caerostris extrusa]
EDFGWKFFEGLLFAFVTEQPGRGFWKRDFSFETPRRVLSGYQKDGSFFEELCAGDVGLWDENFCWEVFEGPPMK